MITLYDGTPGSGKSLNVIRAMVQKLKKGGNVIANFPIATQNIKGMKGKFIFKENKDMTVEFFYKFAFENHKKGKEGQTVIIWDECQSVFNPRDFGRADRRGYNDFFSLHRHLGYNVILITQNDRLIDRQIRCLIEYRVKHRKLNNFGTIGMLMPLKTFACVEYWYGVNEKLSTSFFVCTKKLTRMYDSYSLFDQIKEKKLSESEIAENVKNQEKQNKLLKKIDVQNVEKLSFQNLENIEKLQNEQIKINNSDTIDSLNNVKSITVKKSNLENQKLKTKKKNKTTGEKLKEISLWPWKVFKIIICVFRPFPKKIKEEKNHEEQIKEPLDNSEYTNKLG